MISIIIPYHAKMKDAELFMDRCMKSIKTQTYTDYEVIVTEGGNAAENINKGIKQAKGWLIKILCMDDYFSHDDALANIVHNFEGGWMITGCSNNPHPYYTGDIHQGNNKLGGLSVITVRNLDPELFDESLHWLLDCDYYKRLYERYGEPTILDEVNVTIEEGDHQATHNIPDERKRKEVLELTQRYA